MPKITGPCIKNLAHHSIIIPASFELSKNKKKLITILIPFTPEIFFWYKTNQCILFAKELLTSRLSYVRHNKYIGLSV